MNIQILSDLHFEFYSDRGCGLVNALDPSGVDVLIAAGDVSLCAYLEDGLYNLASRYPNVVFVPGNHEYYRADPDRLAEVRLHLQGRCPNLHWLEEEVCVIGGQRFVGTTLWFPDLEESRRYRRNLPDFSLIGDFVPWVFDKNRKAVAFLDREVQEGDVVVTHHLPSQRSVAVEYKGNPLNPFFVCDVEPLVANRGAKLWVHGHTHSSCDYNLGGTRVVCNPMGYPHEKNVDFDPKCMVKA